MTYRSTENLKNLGSQLRKQQILEKYQPVFDDFNLFKSPKSLKIPENFKHFNLSQPFLTCSICSENYAPVYAVISKEIEAVKIGTRISFFGSFDRFSKFLASSICEKTCVYEKTYHRHNADFKKILLRQKSQKKFILIKKCKKNLCIKKTYL